MSRAHTRVVLTGFGAFPNVPRNATAEIIEAIARENRIALRMKKNCRIGRGEIALGSRRVAASLLVLPVSWEDAGAIVVGEARAMRASLVLMSGVAAPVQSIFIERGSSSVKKNVRDAFGAWPVRRVSVRRARGVSIDVDAAKEAAERALAIEIESSAEMSRVVTGVLCADVRADNVYVCNATTHAVATARVLGARHGFLHWPRDIEARDVPACARVLLAMTNALTPIAFARDDEAD